MRPEDVRSILERTGSLRHGHFRLTSGLHSDLFVLCAQALQHPEDAAPLAAALAEPFRRQRIAVVVGTAVGGIILAYEVARQLGVRSIFAEKDGRGTMALRRGFEIRPREPALVVEDALTTGGSVRAVIDVVRGQGGEIAGVAALVDRTGGTLDLGVPLHALLSLRASAWSAEECPLCRAGVPLVEPKASRR